MAVNINVYWGPRKRTAKDSIPQLQAHSEHWLLPTKDSLAGLRWEGLLKKRWRPNLSTHRQPVTCSTCWRKARTRRTSPRANPFRNWVTASPSGTSAGETWKRQRRSIAGRIPSICHETVRTMLVWSLTAWQGPSLLGRKSCSPYSIDSSKFWKPDWGSIWRDVQEGHPASSREHPTRVQYAFYQQQGLASQGRTVGKEVGVPQGRMWVDETAAPILEEV